MTTIMTHIHYPDRVRVGTKDGLSPTPALTHLSLVAEATVAPNGCWQNHSLGGKDGSLLCVLGLREASNR